MSAALREWQTRQPKTSAPTPGSLEADVDAIRREVFRPLGGGVYDAKPWNAFSWPAALPPFMLVNPDILVKLPGDEIRHVVLRSSIGASPFANHERMVFL